MGDPTRAKDAATDEKRRASEDDTGAILSRILADRDGRLDDMVDGDRQLTTDADAIDGGLNDSDLGSERDLRQS